MRAAVVILAIPIAVCVSFPAAALAGKGVLGIDVSRFNGTIDWARVSQSSVRFAFVQASRGSGSDCAVKSQSCGADPNYDINYASARAAGIRVGPYHRAFAEGAKLAHARADAAAEASVFLESVGGLVRGDLRPALDVETPFVGVNEKRLHLWVRTWVKRVRKRLGVMPIVYTNVTSWRATGNTREFARAGSPLWIANWGVRRPAVPARNWAGKGWTIWQFTSSGTIPGVRGRVDLNRLRRGFRRIAVR